MKLNTQRGASGRPFKTMALLAAAITTVTFQSQGGVSSDRACCQTAEPRNAAIRTANGAIMSSPRFQEEFPWLAANGISRTESIQKAAAAESALANLARNHALAASPRFIEEYPQMARANGELERRPSPEYLPAAVRRNSALAASPRVIEEFPWLARGGSAVEREKFEVAPLK